MSDAFNHAAAFVLAWEAGWVDDPVDSGGATCYGITQRTYDAWLADKRLPSSTVKFISTDEVADILKSRYWAKVDGDRIAALCPNLAFVMMDSAVQHGPRWAAVTLQRTVGVEVDGEIGPATMLGLKLALLQKGTVLLLTGYLNRRMGYYQSIIAHNPTQEKFRNGWKRRLNDLAVRVGLRPVWVEAA